jgi:SAM-dependent methyltransferase
MPAAFRLAVSDFLGAVPKDKLVVEIGSGRGALEGLHPGYVATDFSFTALTSFTSGPRVQADVQRMPFKDHSLGAVISIATLEHVPRPEVALAEIDRVLKPRGRAFLNPAWYVRPWASTALNVRSYGELPLWDRLRKLTLIVRDRRPYQGILVMPGRISREIQLSRGRPPTFSYRKLAPNLDEMLVSDSDAFSSLDPHAVSTFFLGRGYRDLRRASAFARLLYGYEPVVVEKPEL